MPELPTHCMWCGAYLQGSATEHRPGCWVPQLAAHVGRPIEAFEAEAARFVPIVPVPLEECVCRTCGHVASSHIGGCCFECGREECWS